MTGTQARALTKRNGQLRRRAWSAGSVSAALVVGLLVAMTGAAQAATTVPLGTAGAYAILAGSGITNTGVTTISGDVGSSPTNSETGFAACPGANCVTLTGANHNGTEPERRRYAGREGRADECLQQCGRPNSGGRSHRARWADTCRRRVHIGVRHIWHDGHADARRPEQPRRGVHLPDREHAGHRRVPATSTSFAAPSRATSSGRSEVRQPSAPARRCAEPSWRTTTFHSVAESPSTVGCSPVSRHRVPARSR